MTDYGLDLIVTKKPLPATANTAYAKGIAFFYMGMRLVCTSSCDDKRYAVLRDRWLSANDWVQL